MPSTQGCLTQKPYRVKWSVSAFRVYSSTQTPYPSSGHEGNKLFSKDLAGPSIKQDEAIQLEYEIFLYRHHLVYHRLLIFNFIITCFTNMGDTLWIVCLRHQNILVHA